MKIKKYYISIETNNNENIIFVVKSLLNENELKTQIAKMYKNALYSFVHEFDFEFLQLINILKMQNMCVANNVFMNKF